MKTSLSPLLPLVAALAAGCSAPEPPAGIDFPSAPAPATGSQDVQIPLGELPKLEGLAWKLPAKYATLEGDRLVVDIPADARPADAVAEAELPASLFAGAKGFSMSVAAKGAALAKPTKSYLGLKFQMHWKENASGREAWPNVKNELGDFAGKTLVNDATFGGAAPDSVTLQLGLQGTSGRVEFDLSTLCGAPSEGIFRRVNEGFRVKYPATVSGDRRRRGVMLPARNPTAEDFETLESWGVTLVRYQMMRNWSGVDDNQDLDDYAAWVDGKLDCLESLVLPEARKRGMKVVVDLHVTPGGRDAAREMAMFRNETWADAFVDTWRRIATRFKGNADVIYGYDLVNEPNQLGRAPIDYWTLQRRAAEAVRAIDPDTTVIVESNGWDAPATFDYLSPLAMDNVIYQVHCYAPMAFTHQGVHGAPVGEAWPDPGKKWDRDFIRATLAPVREFEKRTGARIYVGEFSAIAWAEGAENYLRDCIAVFEEFGWDWSYHAFREWRGWSVEHEGPDIGGMVPSADNPRRRVLLEGFARP